VSSLGLAKGVGGLPVQVGCTNTVSSLGLAKGVVELTVQVGCTPGIPPTKTLFSSAEIAEWEASCAKKRLAPSMITLEFSVKFAV